MTLRIFENHMSQLHDMLVFVQNFLSSDHVLEMGHPCQAKFWFSSFLHSSFKAILIFGTVKTL
jgi:hypothetical protein